MQESRPHLLRLGRQLSKEHQSHRNADSEDTTVAVQQGLSGSEQDQDGSAQEGEPNLKLSHQLWMFSRKIRDAEVIGSGDPKKVARRAKNRAVRQGSREGHPSLVALGARDTDLGDRL